MRRRCSLVVRRRLKRVGASCRRVEEELRVWWFALCALTKACCVIQLDSPPFQFALRKHCHQLGQTLATIEKPVFSLVWRSPSDTFLQRFELRLLLHPSLLPPPPSLFLALSPTAFFFILFSGDRGRTEISRHLERGQLLRQC